MGLFNSIFGIGKKQNYSELIPEPPKFSLAGGSQQGYVQGLQDLIDVFQRRSQGQDEFDYMSYLYQPQETLLRKEYGVPANPADVFSARTGALPDTLASLNARGLLDTGVSGVIEGQLRSNLADKLAESYGGARQLQRQDIDAALSNLNTLFPQRFQAQNIQSEVDYNNALNSYNALLQRNAATATGQAAREAQKTQALQSGLGLVLGGVGGGMAGMGMFGGTPLAGGGLSQFAKGFAGNVMGQYNPYDSLKDLFPSSPSRVAQTQAPGNTGSPLLNYGGQQMQTSQPPTGYRNPFSIGQRVF